MINRVMAVVVVAIASVSILGARCVGAEGKKAEGRKKVLVELYTSQGCDSCPPAADLLGRLTKLGYGADRIVPVAFHVDYFNDPWKDPFSDPEFSRRQMSYNSVQQRDDLYFTPMMMVDGRYPLLGSNQPRALEAIKRSLAEKPAVSLELALAGDRDNRSLSVELAAAEGAIDPIGRELMVGVAVTEDPVSTEIPAGENAGKTLLEHHAARSFAFKSTRLERTGSRTLRFSIKPGADWAEDRCQVAVFVQDRQNGRVYQADSLPWLAKARAESKNKPAAR
jgi:hypothetical protein